jgi:hypothetical protein
VQLPEGLTVPNSAVGLLFIALLWLLAAALRRLDKGSDTVVNGMGALNTLVTADAAAARARADIAERDRAQLLSLLARVQEYARSLEDDLGRPHRAWDDL